MRPLLFTVVAVCLVLTNALPENIEDVKELPQTNEPVVEAAESSPQARKERCSTCSGTLKLNGKSPKDVLAAIQALPGAEVHTQQSFEGCSSDKGCAGIKVKDGRVVEKFGNLDSFNAAAAQNSGNEFSYHAAGSFDNSIFDGALKGGPFWWMNQNSPFKNTGAGGSFEKFSKSSSSSFTSNGNGALSGSELGANPFLNGDFSKLAGGFGSSGSGSSSSSSFSSSGASTSGQEAHPSTYQTSSFESSSFKEVDVGSNPFLNGGAKFGSSGFGSQFGGSKFGASGSGFTGSTPGPFTASTGGSNVNLVQNTQKQSEFDYEQQSQTNIDEAFQNTGNVLAPEHSGGGLQQTCAGQGYICVHKAQCNNGVVNTNGGNLLQARTQKQYCNTNTEICCRIEVSGAGSQGSLGVGSGSFSSQGQGNLFQSGSSSSFGAGQGSSSFNSGSKQESGFANSFGASGSANRGTAFGSTVAPTANKYGGFNNEVYKSTSQSSFVETDSFSAGSQNSGVYRPGASGSGLKPGIPYLPPIDNTNSGSNVVTSTAYPTSFVTTPRPFNSPRPFTTPKPTYVPSTSAPGYLPPVGESSNNRETILPPNPSYPEGSLILDETRQPTFRPPVPTRGPSPNDIPAGCAAALKCTPIEFCTAEGVISNTTVVLTREQDAYRVPLTDCKDLGTGRIGKCCRDPLYTDPWPSTQLGKWVPGVFGGNDGKYVPDSRPSPTNNQRPQVTVRPPVTGSVVLNNFRTEKPTVPTFGPNQITPGYPSSTVAPTYVQKTQSQGQFGQGQITTVGQGQAGFAGQGQLGVIGIGQGSKGSQGQFAQGSQFSTSTSSFGQSGSRGQGLGVTQGNGASVSQGAGFGVSQGAGFGVSQGAGFGVSQGVGFGVTQGAGFGVSQERGQTVTQGQGLSVTQGQGAGVTQGQGQITSQGQGFGVFQGAGQISSQGQGFGASQGAGQISTQGQGFGISQGVGQTVNRGQGFGVSQGSGQTVSQGSGQTVSQGVGQVVTQGQGFGVSQGQGSFAQGGRGQFGVGQVGFTQQGQSVSQGQGQAFGQGLGVITGQGSVTSQGQTTQGLGVIRGQGAQGQGFGVTRGQGQAVSQGQGFGGSQGAGQATQFGQGSQGQIGQGFEVSRGQTVSQTTSQSVSQGQGQGFGVIRGSGQAGSQGNGFGVSQGSGLGVSQGFGQGVSQGLGQTVSQGFGQSTTQGFGQGVTQGQGQAVSQGFGQGATQGFGQGAIQGFGQGVTQSSGQSGSQGFGQGISQGSGQSVTQGFGQGVSQGFGQGISQGSGQSVTQGFGQGVSQGFGQGASQGSGQSVSQGFGQGVSQGFGQGASQGFGQGASQGSGQSVSQGFGQGVSQGFGQGASQGSGQSVSQGFGQGVSQGFGQSVSQSSGQGVSQGFGQEIGQGFGGIRGQGQELTSGQGVFGQGQIIRGGGSGSLSFGIGQAITQGQGQALIQGEGQVSQGGIVSGIRRGQGYTVAQGAGFGVENEYSESVQRVFLKQYSAGGQCGLLNPQKPYGNRNDLEVDFAEIPWQAMVLLQTNRSLLCGGVITRPDVVITSAACVDGLEAKNVLIKGGEWKLGIDDEPLPFQIVQVKTILRHPYYKRGSLKYDAAILVLSENLRFAKNIYPICLPGASETLDAFYNGAGECIVTGWGKQVLQAHLQGSIMHSLNVSLTNPGECEAKLTSDYPHLLEQYDQESCVCGQPTNPINNICKVDIGSALACTTGDGHFTLRGVYSWDSGCQVGNQIAAFYKFDLEWYEWAIGLIESVRFAQFTKGAKVTQNRYTTGIINSEIKSNFAGVKGGIQGVKTSGSKFGFGEGQVSGQYNQFGKFEQTNGNLNFGSEVSSPISNTFSATYSEKKVFQSEPKYVTYTTKPEIVTFTTKPEYFTYTTKPKIVTYTTKPEIISYTTKPKIVTYTTKPEIFSYTTKPKIVSYTTKPQIITYETSGSGTNPQYVAPEVTFNPSFSELVAKDHKHNNQCKCLEGKK